MLYRPTEFIHITYPKVLVISPDSISSSNGTGLTLASLFAGWAPERLANLYYCGDAPPTSACSQSWQVQPCNLASRIFAKAARELLSTIGGGTVAGLNGNKDNSMLQLRLGTTFQALDDLVALGVDDVIMEQVEKFQPDLVYSLLWSLKGIKITEQVLQRTGVAVVPHFMDDWPSTTYQQTILRPAWRILLLRRLRRVLLHTHVGLAICDDMAEEYSRRYGLSFTAFMRCVDMPVNNIQKLTLSSSPLRLIYTGGLHLGRSQVLSNVASAVDQLSSTEIECVLTVHSPRDQEFSTVAKMQGTSNCVHWGGVLPPDKVDEALAEADVAIHVESFDPRATAYTRLSVSTKFPSYLAAGLPILAVGPPNIASIRYVEQHGIGLTVTQPDPEEIKHCLRRLQDKDQWRVFAERAQRLFREQHYAPDVQSKFTSILEQAVRSKHK